MRAAEAEGTPLASAGIPSWLHLASRVTAILLAMVWAYAGFSKVWGTVSSVVAHPALLLTGHEAGPGVDWASTFPAALLIAVLIAEIIASWLILAGSPRRGLLIGAALVGAFFLALMIWPIPPGSSCGCMGSAAELPGTPVTRLSLLGGMHAFCLAVVARHRKKS